MAKLQKIRLATPQPGGHGWPPRCRATGPQGPTRNFLREIFSRNTPAAPLPGGQAPAARQRRGRVYSCKFPNRKYIFVKNVNIKYKNKKTAMEDTNVGNTHLKIQVLVVPSWLFLATD